MTNTTHKCSKCGAEQEMPANARPQEEDGYFFECVSGCGGTLFVLKIVKE